MYKLISLVLTCSLPLVANSSVLFQNDFSSSTLLSDYEGSAENLFDGIYSEPYGTPSIDDGALQVVVEYSVDGGSEQQSTTRMTRLTDLPVVDNFVTVSLDYAANIENWTTGDQSVFGLSVGENFRGSAFNPAGGGFGPDFVGMSLEARSTQGQFRYRQGGGPGSSNFDVVAEDGFYHIEMFFAFNNGSESQEFDSPTGLYILDAGRFAAWANGVLVWDNTDHRVDTAANISDFSFGLGDGTFRTFEEGQPYEGIYRLDNILITTVPEPRLAATLVGILILGLVIVRRRHRC